jgi:DNA-directed RNA polymerase subunit alpha
VYTPVRKAGFKVESTRVGQKTDLERLVIEVWTDATLTPMDAVRAAAAQLNDRFLLFANLEVGRSDEDPLGQESVESSQALTSVESLDLSARTLNCLKRAGIHRVGEVLKMPKRDLLRIRNFGQKSLDELYQRLEEKGFWSPDPPADSAEGEASESGDSADSGEASSDGAEEVAAVTAGETENEA